MHKFSLFITIVSTIALIANLAIAEGHGHSHGEHKHKIDSLHIKAPWIRSTAPGAITSAAYFTINNNTDKDITLTAAKSDIAKRVEVHEHSMEDGIMKMQQVSGVLVPKQSSTEFKPGSYHVMFMGLKDSVEEGQKINITLVFDNGIEQIIEAIAKKKADAHSHKDHENKHHDHKN